MAYYQNDNLSFPTPGIDTDYEETHPDSGRKHVTFVQGTGSTVFASPSAIDLAFMQAKHSAELAQAPAPHVLRGLPLGTLGLIVGGPGVGKSTFALGLAMSVAAGRDLLRIGPELLVTGEPRDVVYMTAENNQETANGRLASLKAGKPELGSDFDRRMTLRALQPDEVSLPLITEMLRRLKPKPQLIVLDSLPRFLRDENENCASSMRMFMRTADAFCRSTGSALIFVHQANKKSLRKSAQQDTTCARGSSEISAVASFQINVVRETRSGARSTISIHNTKSAAPLFQPLRLELADGIVRVPSLFRRRDELGRFVA